MRTSVDGFGNLCAACDVPGARRRARLWPRGRRPRKHHALRQLGHARRHAGATAVALISVIGRGVFRYCTVAAYGLEIGNDVLAIGRIGDSVEHLGAVDKSIGIL